MKNIYLVTGRTVTLPFVLPTASCSLIDMTAWIIPGVALAAGPSKQSSSQSSTADQQDKKTGDR